LISLPPSTDYVPQPQIASPSVSEKVDASPRLSLALSIFGAAIFLVSVPVFFQAPLVRSLPLLSLLLTGFWTWLSIQVSKKPETSHWGEILAGFTWTWLAGSLYWGWLRWEPTLHLPIEAIGLPIALWGLKNNWCKIGNFFYIGSLAGTVITDIYFYLVDLIPYWRQLMQAEPELVQPIFQQALVQMNTPWGISWVIALALMLLSLSVVSFRLKNLPWLAFSGAVLSTLLVDSLFWVAALLA
jgi:Protein of unknown function (DUF3120)